MKLKCQCCGFEQDFDSLETAFQAGWDAPPHFTGYVTCDLCPAVCIVAGLSHEKAHEHWQKYGRPTEFNLGTCAPDAEWRGSNVPPSSDD